MTEKSGFGQDGPLAKPKTTRIAMLPNTTVLWVMGDKQATRLSEEGLKPDIELRRSNVAEVP
jgi:hypothetical protein